MQSQIKFESVLEKEGELFFTNVGYSMYPLIKQREDILHIVKTDSIKRGDIILYKSNTDHYVLHRVLRIKKDMIIAAGDYNFFKDQPFTFDKVLGKLVDIKKKDGKTIDLNKDKKARKFFCTNFFHIKAFFQIIGKILHIRKVK